MIFGVYKVCTQISYLIIISFFNWVNWNPRKLRYDHQINSNNFSPIKMNLLLGGTVIALFTGTWQTSFGLHLHILPYDVYWLICMTSLLSHSIQKNGDKLIWRLCWSKSNNEQILVMGSMFIFFIIIFTISLLKLLLQLLNFLFYLFLDCTCWNMWPENLTTCTICYKNELWKK